MEKNRGQVYTKNTSAVARKVRAEALEWKQGTQWQ